MNRFSRTRRCFIGQKKKLPSSFIRWSLHFASVHPTRNISRDRRRRIRSDMGFKKVHGKFKKLCVVCVIYLKTVGTVGTKCTCIEKEVFVSQYGAHAFMKIQILQVIKLYAKKDAFC